MTLTLEARDSETLYLPTSRRTYTNSIDMESVLISKGQ